VSLFADTLRISEGMRLRNWLPIALSAALLYAQEPDPVFHAASELVLVDVLVTAAKTGRGIGGLTRSDFSIAENGIPQTIAQFSHDTIPISLVFLFDVTDSVRPVLQSLAAGALAALEHLKSADEVSVVAYGVEGQTRLLQKFTADRTLAVDAIRRASEMPCKSGALFNEGIFQAAAQSAHSSNPSNRRVIVWLTDNVPNVDVSHRFHSEKAALNEAYERGDAICTILERSGMSDAMIALYSRNPLFAGMRKHSPPGDVYRYADNTGGIVLKSAKQAEVRKTGRQREIGDLDRRSAQPLHAGLRAHRARHWGGG
jgi:VWFA-related protein